ncbi:MAG: DUF2062 domain-containing protein [Rhodocyclaceae bacterium]|nr:DUF2062 domain-containing protein [Rhodocyclaceae bacterium]
MQRINALGKPLMVGLSIMACLGGVLTYGVIDRLWRWRTLTRWRNRQKSARFVDEVANMYAAMASCSLPKSIWHDS